MDRELLRWKAEADKIPTPLLRIQAVSSLQQKAFHCYGGSVLALLSPAARRNHIVRLIVAFQTISDYLDNLCDRAGIVDEAAFLALHRAMSDALMVGEEPSVGQYYARYGGLTEETYLAYLVKDCRTIAESLPSFDTIAPYLSRLINDYAHLQALKHLSPDVRENRLSEYIGQNVENSYGLCWWELAAATGSTLAMFALMARAADPNLTDEEAQRIYDAYFPWICGLHILLDYYIDEEEDRQTNDLNFVAFYPQPELKLRAIRDFADQAMIRCAQIEFAPLHRLTVTGLLAMYLADDKLENRRMQKQRSEILKHAGTGTAALHAICRAVRKRKEM